MLHLAIEREFNPNEPRDERGRWTDGGGSDVAFISPNVSTLTIHEAVNALNNDRHRKIAEASNAIDKALGIKGENHPVIGAWSDGAENSIMVTSPGASTAQVRAASAMKGYIADQKAVLVFHPNHDGQNVLASFDVEGKAVDLHERLLKEGLSFHTLEPVGEGRFRVHVFASDEATLDTVAKASAGFDVVPEFVRGNGEFIGTTKEDGTDREQRDDARRQYEQVIQTIASSGALEGQDIGKTWNEIRDRWSESEASAGKSKHPGKGYSASARLIDGVIHTSNVYDAQRALAENKRVDLKQLKQVSTLIKTLGETAAKMEAQGEAAPTFNLCNVSIEGTSVFCGGNKGIPRAEMPVIPAKRTGEFIRYLKERGYAVEKGHEEARNLRATQSEISGAKVAAAMARIKRDGVHKRLVVSRDDYLLDGHHTWSGQLGLDAKDGNLENDNRSMKIARVDIPIMKLIEEADKFTGGKGKKPASEPARVPKMFKQMKLSEASYLLPPELFRKYYDTACEFFDANKHLDRDIINDLVVVVRDWDESKHPRGESGPGTTPGSFTSGGGGGGGDSDSSAPAHEAKPAETKTKYGLTPGDAEKFEALKLEKAALNNELGSRENMKNPGGPEATKLLLQMAEISKEINKLHADPGDATGIYKPGGPRDTLIIGAGPGGLGAAINGALEGLDTQVVEAQLEVGGQAKYSSRIENFLGFPIGVTGEQLTQSALTQAERLGAEITVGVRVTEMTFGEDGMKHVKLSNGETVDARTVIIGGGIEFRKVKFPGSEGPGIFLGNAQELAATSKGKTAVVVGGSNGASQAALLCAEQCDHVFVLSRSPIAHGMSAYQVYGLKANPKITVIENDEIKQLERDENGNPKTLETKKGQKLSLGAVGIFAGGVPETKWVPEEASRDYKAKSNDNAKLRTNADLEILDDLGDAIPGLFAVGDMRDGSIGRIMTAASEGQVAIRHAQAHLEKIREAAGLAPKPKREEKASAPKKPQKEKRSNEWDKWIDAIVALDLDHPWFGQTVDDQPPLTPTDEKKDGKETDDAKKKTLELEERAGRKTVVELWPEEGEKHEHFMSRCITGLTKCVGPKKAPRICATKWRKSAKHGKKKPDEKAFVARGLDEDEATETCGETCVGCKGADAPFDLREFDEGKHPRDPAGKWTDSGGSDDELGSMALGGEDRHITPSTRKVDALRDEMGVTEADVPFEQRQALDMYTADSTSFNQRARLGPGPDSPETQHLDTLVSRYKLPHDVTVYRTIGWQRTKDILSHLDGSFSDPGFMSTTLDKSKIEKPGTYIEIQVPKDSKAFPIGSLSSFQEEAEIVFPRNSRLQIISHEPRTENTERFVARLVS